MNGTNRSSYGGPRNRRHRRRAPHRGLIIGAAAAGGAVLLGTAIFFAAGQAGEWAESSISTEASQTQETPARLTAADLTIGNLSLNGMTQDEALAALKEAYPWSMAVAYGEEETPLPDLLTPALEALVAQVYEAGAAGTYPLPADELKEALTQEAADFAAQWDVKPKNSALDRFDLQSGSFIFSEGCSGTAVNQEKLVSDILAAVERGETDALIQAEILDTAPELTMEQAKARYKTLATFTTETTDNKKRNTNVRLAAEALNGTIVQPGEEFSFNAVVGQRTAEKGYQQAAAYSGGEVVQEIGGGVCQISSTLYRVVFKAGMEITFRRSHTFEPNYVTPGQDAAISWEQPDFRFVNTSSAPVGIRASYSDRKASVSIYGIPVLEEGISWDLYSEKAEELDPPAPVYIEDPTLEPGTEKVQSAGTKGSRWVTYKVIYKDGQEIERAEDHSKTYKGHAPVIRRNTSAQTLPEGETAPAETLPTPGVDGMPEGYVGGESVPETSGAPESVPETEEAAGDQTVPVAPLAVE